VADSTTPNVKLTNQTEGGNNNTWGTIADNNFEAIDNKFGDLTQITTTGGNTTLSDAQEIVAIVEVGGVLVANSTITFSGRGGVWLVKNETSGNFSVTCKVTGQPGVIVPQGTQRVVYCDGVDIIAGNTDLAVVGEVTIASAATCNILGSDSEFIAISGTATITSFGTGATKKRYVRAAGAFKITHHATTLICPGGQSITTVAGDTFIVISDATNNARIYAYQRAAQPPVGVPVGAVFDFAGAVAPPYYLLCFGQTLLRLDWPALFAAIGTTYGTTDSTNFLLPDKRGRVSAGKDNMGGTSANRLTNQSGGLDGDVIGATGGLETHTLTLAESPPHTHTFSGTTSSAGSHSHNIVIRYQFLAGSGSIAGLVTPSESFSGTINETTDAEPAHTHTVSGTTSFAGSGSPHNNVQPTIIFNTIICAGI
jgi:microcystin-dependent protein